MNAQRAIREKVAIVVALIALLWAMDWMYVNILVVLFGGRGYPGYPFEQRGPEFRLLCWAIGLLPAVWMPSSAKRPSDVITWCVFLMVNLPTAVVGTYSTMTADQIVAMNVALAGGLGILSAVRLLPALRLPAIRFNPSLFWAVVVAFSICSYAAAVVTFGSSIRFVSLQEVYLQRLASAQVATNLGISYLVSWQETAINPLLMALGIARRRPFMFFAGALGEVFLFGVHAQRFLLVVPFIVLGFHWFLRRGGTSFAIRAAAASFIAFAIPVFSVLAGGFAPVLSEGFVPVLIRLLYDSLLNRLYLNSGFITTLYFKFFDSHPHVGFAEVKPFNLFLHSPYSLHYTEVLSWDVWGTYSDPNANFFADGFAQLGYTGLVLEAAGFAAILWVLDSIARQRKLSVWLVGMCCAAQIPVITNAATSNILVGSGFGLILLLLAAMPRSETSTVWVSKRARQSHVELVAAPIG